MWNIVKNGLIMTAYSLVAGALLAFVYLKTAPVIEAQKAAKSGAGVMAQVLTGMDGGFEERGDENFTYWAGYKDSGRRTAGGYVLIVRGSGYTKSVPIETMVGVDADGNVVGVKIINQQETPGLGDKVMEIKAGESDPWFTRQFIGKTAEDNLLVVKDGGAIDAISGATISSRAVTNSIRNGLLALQAALSGGEFVMPVEEETEETAPEDKPVTMPADDALAAVLPGMAAYELKDKDTGFPYWIAYKDASKSQTGGHLFLAREVGFVGMIETLVGVGADGKIAGLKIIAHEETADYGGLMEEIRAGEKDPWFTRQFKGKSAVDNLKIKDDGGPIDAISGATISSKAFTLSIDNGLKRLKAVLSGETFVPAEPPKPAKPAKVESPPFVEVSAEDALEDVLPAMFGGYELKEGAFPYWIAWRDPGKTIIGGYAYVAEGEGFASTLRTLVAVDPDLTIIGAKLLSHEETDGWGSKITEVRDGEDEPWFIAQFMDKTVNDTIALKEDGGAIDAITEATVTSEAVTTSIASGLKSLQTVLGGGTVAAPAPAPAAQEVKDEDEGEFVRVAPETALEEIFTGDPIFELRDGGSDLPYWIVFSDPARIEAAGYAFVAKGEGFASTIETLVGTDAKGTIVGVRVLFHEETDGWGSKIMEKRDGGNLPWFPEQFVGKTPVDTIALTENGGDIDAITEATVTSDAVTTSIADGLARLKAKI